MDIIKTAFRDGYLKGYEDGAADVLKCAGPAFIKEFKRIQKTAGIERVVFNDPATVVFWTDGSKTVVKAQDGEPFDPEKGLAMAIVKKMYGNTGSYNELFKKFCPPEE